MDNNTIDNCDITIIDDNNQQQLVIHIDRDDIQQLPELPSIRPDTDENIIRQIRNQFANVDSDDNRYDNAIIRYASILEFSGQFDQDMVQKFDQNEVDNVVVFPLDDYEERIEPRHLRKLQLLMECTTNQCWPIRHLRKYGKYLDKLTTCDCACLCHLITKCYFTKTQLLALEEIGVFTQDNIQLMYGQQQLVSNYDIQILRNLAWLYVKCGANVFNVVKRIFEHIYNHKLSDEIPLLGNAIGLQVYSSLIGAKELLIEVSVSIHKNRDDILTKLFKGMRKFINMLEERNKNANANQFIDLATEVFRHQFYYNSAEQEISRFLLHNPHSSKLAFVGYYTRMLKSFMKLEANVQIIHSLFGGLIPQLQNGDRRQNFIFRYIVPYQCYNNILTMQQLMQQHDSGIIQDILAKLANGIISLPKFSRDQCLYWVNCQNDAWNSFVDSDKKINKGELQAYCVGTEKEIILFKLKVVICDILAYINPQ